MVMRYGEGGGLDAAARARREQVRFAAADRFAEGATRAEVAREFRVSDMTTSRWYRTWQTEGRQGLASLGAGGATCKLDPDQLRRLEALLEPGPAVHGWDEDQCWTPARIAELIDRWFGVSYTVAGVDLLLHRIGWSWQAPVRRTAERDETRIAAWTTVRWPAVKARRRPGTPGWSSRTRPART